MQIISASDTCSQRARKINLPSQKSREELQSLIASVTVPVIAIGGITTLNLEEILCQGLNSIAVISAVNDAETPAAVIRRFVKMLEERHAVAA